MNLNPRTPAATHDADVLDSTAALPGTCHSGCLRLRLATKTLCVESGSIREYQGASRIKIRDWGYQGSLISGSRVKSGSGQRAAPGSTWLPEYSPGSVFLKVWIYFQVNVITSLGQSLPFKRITVGSTWGGKLRVASAAERLLLKLGAAVVVAWLRTGLACPWGGCWRLLRVGETAWLC